MFSRNCREYSQKILNFLDPDNASEAKARDENNFVKLIFITRLNSGIKNRLNFLAWAIYIFQKVVSDSVNHADSEDIKILIQFPGKSIFENFAQFLKKRGRHQYAWVFDSQNHSGCSTFYADQFHI